MQNLAKALLAAQATMPDAVKDSTNPHFHSKYASYESVRSAVTPHLAAQGLMVVQTFEPATPVDAGPIIITTLIHVSGEKIESRLFLPASKKDAQGFGSCITYGRRYGLQSICGIGGDEDDDGNAGVGRPAPTQRTAPPPAAQQPRPAATPAQQAATPPPLSSGRREVAEKLMAFVANDKQKAMGYLSCIIPGRTSVAQLTDHETEICKLVISAGQHLESEQAIIDTKKALQGSIRSGKNVHEWGAEQVKAAWSAIRGEVPASMNSIPPNHSAANVTPDDCPF